MDFFKQLRLVTSFQPQKFTSITQRFYPSLLTYRKLPLIRGFTRAFKRRSLYPQGDIRASKQDNSSALWNTFCIQYWFYIKLQNFIINRVFQYKLEGGLFLGGGGRPTFLRIRWRSWSRPTSVSPAKRSWMEKLHGKSRVKQQHKKQYNNKFDRSLLRKIISLFCKISLKSVKRW